MQKHTTSYDKPISGVATVTVGRKSFTISLTYKDSKDRTKTEDLEFGQDELPEDLPDGWQLKDGKKYFVAVSSDMDKLLTIRPAKGTYEFTCSGIAKTRNGEDFFVNERTGDYGPFAQFVANLMVTKGPDKGIIYPHYLPLSSGDRMRFVPENDGTMGIAGNPEKSRPIANLYDWVEKTGLDDPDSPPKYPTDDDDEPSTDPQDILAVLDKEVRKRKRIFMGMVELGYIKSLGDADDDPDPDDDETPATKRRSVKADENDEAEEKPVAKKRKPTFEE